MRLFRAHKGLIARLAGLAMLAHVIAVSFCPNMNSHRPEARMFDAVLGWVTLCLPSVSGDVTDQGKSGGGERHSEHGNLCAAFCAAVATTVAAFAVLILSAVVFSSSQQFCLLISLPGQKPHFLFGGVGSRAPPALVSVHNN